MIDGRSIHNFLDAWHPHDTDLEVLDVCQYEIPNMPRGEALLLNGIILQCHTSSRKAPKETKQPSKRPLDSIYTEDGERIEVDLACGLASDRPEHF
jgi:hypothetical protein